MNDNFHEQLITKKQKGNPLVIRIIVVVFIILFLTIGALFLGFLSIIIAVVLGVTAYFYIFPNLSVEYEYSLVNHELDITAIYSKSKRKELCSFDIKEAEMSFIIHSGRTSKKYRYDCRVPVDTQIL